MEREREKESEETYLPICIDDDFLIGRYIIKYIGRYTINNYT